MEWLPPLRWYWSQVGDYVIDDPVLNKGISWIELAVDFEIATRKMLHGKNLTKSKSHAATQSGKGSTTMIQRAKNFAAASRRVLAICNGEKLPVEMSVPTLLPFGGRPISGLPKRMKLLNPRAVFRELATQALTYRKAFEPGNSSKEHWQWPPRYVGIPPQIWGANPEGIEPTKRRLRHRIDWAAKARRLRASELVRPPEDGVDPFAELDDLPRRAIRSTRQVRLSVGEGAQKREASANLGEGHAGECPSPASRRRITSKTRPREDGSRLANGDEGNGAGSECSDERDQKRPRHSEV